MRLSKRKVKSKLNNDFGNENEYSSKYTNREIQALQLKKQKEKSFENTDKRIQALFIFLVGLFGTTVLLFIGTAIFYLFYNIT